MKHALIITASALVLAACGADTGENGFATTDVDEETAASALAALHLAESGEGTVSWDSRSFEDGVYTFTGVVFQLDDDEDAATREMNGLEAEPEVALAEVMTLAAPRFDANGNVIFDQLDIRDITVSDPDGEGDGAIDRFLVERPNWEMARAFAQGFSGDSIVDADVDEGSWTYGLLAIEGFRLVGRNEAEPFTASFDRFAIEDLADYSIGRFELSNLLIEGRNEEAGLVRISLAEISADNIGEAITYPFTAQMALAGASFSADVPNEDITADIPEIPEDFDPLNGYENATIRGLDANVGGIIVTLDSLTASTREDRNELVYESEMTPLIIAPDTNYPFGAQLALGLGMMGYQQLEFVAAGASVYERDEDRAYTTDDNYFEMRDGFRVEVESDMSGLLAYSMAALQVNPAMDEVEPDIMYDMLRPLMLNNFLFRLEDLSLLDRALTAGSAVQGVPKENLRMQAGGMIALATLGAPAEIPRELLAEFSTAMTSFVAEGGTLELRIAPDQPISVGDLVEEAASGSVDYAAAGISISAIPPEDEN
ncbi:hypothetical protein [Hyphobacterium sp.]|uniref:hypothetical protein n=1 Tax=Hyphobacterium sp. TaxID=2004662 RepID=UPI003BAB23B1